MKKIILYSAIGLLTSLSAQAEYQTSFDLGYIDTDEDSGFLIGGTYHFDSVDDSKGPLSEAAFLDKASGISAGFASVGDADVTALAARFVLESDYTLYASYIDNDFDSTLGIGVGKYLTDNSEAVLSYATDDFSDVLALNYHQLNDLSGSASFSYDLGVSYIDTDADTGYGINGAVAYYPSDELGFGAFAQLLNGGAFGADTYGINGEYFFDRNMALDLELSRVDFGSTDSDTLTLTFEARF